MYSFFKVSEDTSITDSERFKLAYKFDKLDKNVKELDKPIAKEVVTNENNYCSDSPEKVKPIQNKIDGLQREADVQADLEKKYPKKQGNDIVSEAYLRNSDGNIVKDPDTGKARRIDFVALKDGKVVDLIEVTSKTANKTEQTAKENRIRDNGGNYIRNNTGNLVKIPDTVRTRIERRD
jgi:hypothetical protein